MAIRSSNYHYDEIYASEFNKLRHKLINIYRGAQQEMAKAAKTGQPPQITFGKKELEAFVDELSDITEEFFFKEETEKMLKTMETGSGGQPDVSSPRKQLLWGAGLVYLALNGKEARANWPEEDREKKIDETAFWDRLKATPTVDEEFTRYAVAMADTKTNPNARLGWGALGSWFYQNPAEHYINLDLGHALIVGLEHTRPIGFHEIGHNEHSTVLPKPMQEIRKKLEAFEKKQKAGKVKEEEYKDAMKLSYEYKLRHAIYNATEDNLVNRFALLMSERVAQNQSPSLNHMRAILGDVDEGEILREHQKKMAEKKGEADVWMQKFNNLTMICATAFFMNNGLIKNTKEDWAKLKLKPNWISRDPKPTEDELPFDDVTKNQDFMDLLQIADGENPKGVGHIMPSRADRIFGKAHWKKKVDECSEERSALIQKIWDEYADQIFQELLKNFDEMYERMKEMAQQASNGESTEVEDGDGNTSQQPQIQAPSEDAGTGQSGGDKKPGQEQDGQGGGEGKEKGQEQDGDGQPGGGDGQKGEKISDIIKRGKGAKDKTDENADQEGKEQSLGAGSGGGLSKLPVGDWTDYAARKRQYAPHIKRVSRMLEKLRDQQIKELPQPKRERTLLPTDGEFDRFDHSKYVDTEIKKASGKDLERSDIKYFKEQQTKVIVKPPELVILIDGSGSMGRADDLSSPMAAAIQAACILSEAAAENDINVYVGIWGNEDPPFIVRPGDDEKKRGKAIEGAAGGLQSGTDLAPAIAKTAREIAENKNNLSEEYGNTHALVLSDGDIFDAEEAKKHINTLFKNVKLITLDIAVIQGYGNRSETSIEKMAKETQTRSGQQQIGTVRNIQANRIADAIVHVLVQKMRRHKSLAVESASKRRRGFKRAASSMKPNKG